MVYLDNIYIGNIYCITDFRPKCWNTYTRVLVLLKYNKDRSKFTVIGRIPQD